MKRNYLETSQEIEALSQELKSLEAREAEVAEAMTISSEALDFAKSQIKKAREMIAKANLLLSKAELTSQAESIRLEQMMAESIQIQLSEAEKRTTLEEAKIPLGDYGCIQPGRVEAKGPPKGRREKEHVVCS